MIATASIRRAASVSASLNRDRKPVRNNLADIAADEGKASRRWFSSMLWRAFPSNSENELAHNAAPVLGVSARQVRNWLRCENDAGLRSVVTVLAIAGAEVVFTQVEGGN